MEPSYWIVGASWGGTKPQDKKWVKAGCWELGFNKGPQKKKAMLMKPGDRIAIKRNGGGRNPKGDIRILHLGIITEVHVQEGWPWCCVDWLVKDMDRHIPDGSGCYRSVHGPFPQDDWIRKVFCL